MPIPVAWTTPGVRKPSHCGIAPLWTGGTGAQRAWGLLLLHLGCCCVLCPWLVSWPWPSEEGSGGHPGWQVLVSRLALFFLEHNVILDLTDTETCFKQNILDL